MAKSSIGLDIGTSAVRAAEVSVAKGGISLQRFGQVALPPGAVVDGEVVEVETVASCIKALWHGAKLQGRKVHLGVSNQHMSVRQATFPWLPPDDFRASLKYQAADLVPMSMDEAVFDFVALREDLTDDARTVTGLLVVAAEHAIDRSVRAATLAGLRPVGVDLVPFALMRAVGDHSAPADRTEVIVDVGARMTNIVVHRGGYPVFVRVLLMGGQDLTRAVVESTGWDGAHAETMKRTGDVGGGSREATARKSLEDAISRLTEEVRGSLDYYQATNPGPPVARIVLTGGGAQAAGLARQLSARNRIQVVAARPFETLRVGRTGLTPEQLAFVESSSAVPVGLALGGVA